MSLSQVLISCFLCCSFFSAAQYNTTALDYRSIDSLLILNYQQGNYPEVLSYMLLGREKAQKEFGRMDSLYLDYTKSASFMYNQLGDYTTAEKLLTKVLEKHAQLKGKNNEQYANSVVSLANIYQTTGRYNESEALFLEANAIYKQSKGKLAVGYASSLNNLGFLYRNMGRYEQAETLFLEAKNIYAQTLGKSHPFYASSLSSLADLYKVLNRYKEAEKLLEESVAIYSNKDGINPAYANTLVSLAALYKKTKQSEKAEKLYLEAKDIYAQTLGPTHPSYATCLNYLAGFYMSREQWNKAEQLLLENKEIYLNKFGKHHPHYRTVLVHLAKLYFLKKDTTQSFFFLNEGLSAFLGEKLTLPVSSEWESLILAQTNDSFDKAINMHGLLSILYDWLALTQAENYQVQQAKIADIALKISKNKQDDFTSQKDKKRMLKRSAEWLDKNLAVMNNQSATDKAFRLVDQNKAVLLLQSAKSQQFYQLGQLPDTLVEHEKKLLKQKAHLQAKIAESPSSNTTDSLYAQLRKAIEATESLKATIEKQYPQYAKFKYLPLDISTQEVQQNLPPRTALVEYRVTDSVIHIFYIDKQNTKWVQESVDIEMLNINIAAFHSVLSDYLLLTKQPDVAYEKYIGLAHWFYQKLLQAVLENQEGITNLILVTDGELGHLPFETFITEEAPTEAADYAALSYLNKKYAISYNYSATFWREIISGSSNSNNGQLLAMAADYTIRVDSATQKRRLPAYQRLRESLNGLPFAQEEVEALSKNFDGTFVNNAQASEAFFKQEAKDYATIHLALHGILNNKNPMLSSLAFVEDGSREENNFLQAFEISKMELNADLVVLSACETGFGKFEQGNGIASLAQAFAYSGAHSLIVSLWQVNDYATAEIMKHLYRYLADGMDKDVALQQAKLNYVANAKGVSGHPAFWSSFILIGDTSPIELSKKNTITWWMLILPLCVLLAGLFWWKRSNG